MKRFVSYSAYSIIITLLLTGFLIVVARTQYSKGQTTIAMIISASLAVLLLCALFYMPLRLSCNNRYITICMPLRRKRIDLARVRTAGLMQPTMGARRIIGSGGWMGYWGWFREQDLGKYFAYYGKASDCIFLRLHDGRQYMLGCSDPEAMADYIIDRIGPYSPYRQDEKEYSALSE